MQIELIDPIPELEEHYRDVVRKVIDKELITLYEWNIRFKFIRDEFGYSIVHYFNCLFFDIDCFLTVNPMMLENKEEFEKRFKIKIMTWDEYLKELKK